MWQALALMTALTSADPVTIPELPVVKNWGDLLQVPEIPIDGKTKVKVGISDSGPDGGPWLLLHCLVVEANPAVNRVTKRASGFRRLGPLSYTVERSLTSQRLLESVQQLIGERENGYYCQVIPIAWKGDYHITIYSDENTKILKRVGKVLQPRACYWQEFASPFTRELTVDDPQGYTTMKPHASHPTFEEFSGLWYPSRQDRENPLLSKASLPGQLPVSAEWLSLMRRKKDSVLQERYKAAFQLTLSNGNVLLTVEDSFTPLPWNNDRLLARWWVNDRVIVPPRLKQAQQDELQYAVEESRQYKVRFGLPETLGELKPGDRVRLQVMYSPGDIELVRESDDEKQGLQKAVERRISLAPEMPLLSNVLEFRVTRKMLEQREKDLKNPERREAQQIDR